MPSLLILAMAAAAAAQTTTVEIWTPIDGDLVATVLGVNDATTTLGISCSNEAVEADECGLPGTDLFTHISGPSTVSYRYDNKLAELLMEGNCEILDDSTPCTYTLSSQGQVASGVEDIGDFKTEMMSTVTITAGAEKLTAGGDAPKETGTEETGTTEGEDKEGEDKEGAAGLARGSLLAAVVAVGAMLI